MIAARYAKTLAAVLSAGALFFASAADACTGIRLTAADGTVVHARTLEFAVDLQSDVLVSPRGFERIGITPDGQDRLKWKAKYASVGANGVGLPILIDGVNEAGLAAGSVLLPNDSRLSVLHPGGRRQDHRALAVGVMASRQFRQRRRGQGQHWLSARRGDGAQAMGLLAARPCRCPRRPGREPRDEYVGGKLNLYDDALGVITNSPAFDWHMTNLCDYVELFVSTTTRPFSWGRSTCAVRSGLGHVGHARRLHAALALRPRGGVQPVALQPKTGDEAVLGAFHILNNFDIPRGSAREAEKDDHGNILADYTLWTAASDFKAKRSTSALMTTAASAWSIS